MAISCDPAPIPPQQKVALGAKVVAKEKTRHQTTTTNHRTTTTNHQTSTANH